MSVLPRKGKRMKEPIDDGYYRLVIPEGGDEPEVNRIVDEFTKRFEKAVNLAVENASTADLANTGFSAEE